MPRPISSASSPPWPASCSVAQPGQAEPLVGAQGAAEAGALAARLEREQRGQPLDGRGQLGGCGEPARVVAGDVGRHRRRHHQLARAIETGELELDERPQPSLHPVGRDMDQLAVGQAQVEAGADEARRFRPAR